MGSHKDTVLKAINTIELAMLAMLFVVFVAILFKIAYLEKKLNHTADTLYSTFQVLQGKTYDLNQKLKEAEAEIKFMQTEPLTSVLCEDLSIRTGQIGKLLVIRNPEHGSVCAADYDTYYTVDQMREMLQWFD